MNEFPLDQRLRLLDALANAYSTPEAIEGVLYAIGLPRARRPAATAQPTAAWRAVFDELDAGVIPDGYTNLVEAFHER
jgi:hypothetical protein